MVAAAHALEKKEPGRRNSGVPASKTLVAKYADKRGVIDAGELASGLFMSMSQLAQTAGLASTTLVKRDRSKGARAQARLREMLEILDLIDDWAGGETLALAWYRSQHIPALNDRTAEALVQDGEAAAVRRYLDHLALGGFA
jgi:hypothetical protein